MFFLVLGFRVWGLRGIRRASIKVLPFHKSVRLTTARYDVCLWLFRIRGFGASRP